MGEHAALARAHEHERAAEPVGRVVDRAATALAIAATARTATPAAARLIPAVVRYRDRTRRHPLYRRVAAHVTLAWAAAELAITG